MRKLNQEIHERELERDRLRGFVRPHAALEDSWDVPPPREDCAIGDAFEVYWDEQEMLEKYGLTRDYWL